MLQTEAWFMIVIYDCKTFIAQATGYKATVVSYDLKLFKTLFPVANVI
jgi:hypothetical protein